MASARTMQGELRQVRQQVEALYVRRDRDKVGNFSRLQSFQYVDLVRREIAILALLDD